MFHRFLKNTSFVKLCLVLLFFELTSAAVPPYDSTIVFYHGPRSSDFTTYSLSKANNVLRHPKFIHSETHLYFFGYVESLQSESVRLLVKAYSKRGNINFLVIDWGTAARENYIKCIYNLMETLSYLLAKLVLRMFKEGLSNSSLTMVGHSLGSQLAGVTARQMMKQSKGHVKVEKMVALDPALPLYTPPFLTTVNKNDVKFLLVLHTAIGVYGQTDTIGHVDFWANGGKRGQPGCRIVIYPFDKGDLCCHQRSWRFWIESLESVNGSNFLGYPAESYTLFLIDGPLNAKKRTVAMGPDCPLNARGNYFFQTNSKPPFAKGNKGYS